MTAGVRVDLDGFTGDDRPPLSRHAALVFDPGVDHVASPVVHVKAITIALDGQGKAATANGVACIDGVVPVVAGVVYAVKGRGVLREEYRIGPFADGDSVNLADVIVSGPPLTPDQASVLAAHISDTEAALAQEVTDRQGADAAHVAAVDPHPQYALADGSRGLFASTAQGAKADTAVRLPTVERHPLTGYYHADAGTGVVTRATLQAAVNAASGGSAQDGQGGIVWVPQPPQGSSWLIDGTVILKSRVTIRGAGKTVTYVRDGQSVLLASSANDLVGNGLVPIFRAGSYPGGQSLDAEYVRLESLSMRNANAPCVRMLTALNFTIRECVMRSFYDTEADTNYALEMRYCYRGNLELNSIGCGRGWAIDMSDNMNGLRIAGNILSGGSLGGAIRLGMSVAVTIDGNVIESSRTGIEVGSSMPVGGGVCHSPRVVGNYLEDVVYPISMGAQFEILGGEVSGNYIGGAQSSEAARMVYGILVGRCDGVGFRNNTIHPRDNTIPMFKVAPLATTWPTACQVVGNHGRNVLNATTTDPLLYDLSEIGNVRERSGWFGCNEVQTKLNGLAPNTGHREWVSPTITANVGSLPAYTTIIPNDGFGAMVYYIGIENVVGSLTGCVIQVGGESLSYEVTGVPVDPSALPLVDGGAEVPLNGKPYRTRANERLRVRVVPGTGTGSFRLRVKWVGR